LDYFSHGKSYVLILKKNLLGSVLGDFFTNSSGHPAALTKKRGKNSALPVNPFSSPLREDKLLKPNQFFVFFLNNNFSAEPFVLKAITFCGFESPIETRVTRMGKFSNIGRFFANWENVSLHTFEIYKSSPRFGAIFQG
jgi:hypothetical protein